jgi:serine/threonine-protein kinase
VHTAPFDGADDRAPSTPPSTKRLQVMTVHGTARAVQKRTSGSGRDEEIWEFRVERYESTGQPHTVVPVELRGTSITGHLSDGDVVKVQGIWDDGILLADSVVNQSVEARGRRKSNSVGARSGNSAEAAVLKARKVRIIVIAGVVVAAILAITIAVTQGIGLWSEPGSGPIVQPARATVFSPGGSPDHPGQAGLAIDRDPHTSWPTDTYVDATPFPAFKQGVGLMLELSEPTALSAVTIDVPSTGTEVQIRAADGASPTSLSDTTELTPSVSLQPGHNRIPVDNKTKTADVLIWISKLGTTDGQSRTDISDITLEAAR